MAAAVAQFAFGRAANSTTVTTAAMNTAGSGRSFLIISSDTSDMSTPTDNKSNTYVALGSGNNNAGNNLRAWLCVNGTGGTGHTASGVKVSAGYPVMMLLEISGALTSGANDSTSYAQGGDDATPYTISTAGSSLAQADNLVIAAFTHNASGSTNATVGSPFTIVGQEMDTNNWWPLAVAARNTSATTTVTASFERTNPGMQTGLLIIVIKSAVGGSIVEADAAISAAVSEVLEGAKILGGDGAVSADGQLAGLASKVLGGELAASGALDQAFVATAVASAIAAVSGESSDAFLGGSIKSAVWAATGDLQASFESNAIASSEAVFEADAAADVLFAGGAVASGVAGISAAADLGGLGSAIVSAAFAVEAAADANALGTWVLSGVATAVLELLFEAEGATVELPGGGGALTPAALLRIMRRPTTNRTMNRPAGLRLMRRTG
ncbi:hypothetical protein H4CHR_04379 [Variovorax sp. PBS-H4]|uniref:hypothetical protein n=1 Tax=Variovorax sp. PBS-H4 TaxID=434008 RepID=UPI001318F24C|nr:hypothetical protein [Variovorax sp. PBS-H4]VTU38259.1 hypothetical protein H4CHR_04379 [Variovorax sp. PBS-H4]